MQTLPLPIAAGKIVYLLFKSCLTAAFTERDFKNRQTNNKENARVMKVACFLAYKLL